jgi:hypothetical protein
MHITLYQKLLRILYVPSCKIQVRVLLEKLCLREILFAFFMVLCAQFLKDCADRRHLNLWHGERN